jgi:hypothetical protein
MWTSKNPIFSDITSWILLNVYTLFKGTIASKFTNEQQAKQKHHEAEFVLYFRLGSFPVQLTVQPRRRTLYAPPKLLSTFNKQHSVVCQKTRTLPALAVTASNHTLWTFFRRDLHLNPDWPVPCWYHWSLLFPPASSMASVTAGWPFVRKNKTYSLDYDR